MEAFATHNEAGMRSALADDLSAYVTNAEGGVDQVHGRDSYVHRLLALSAPTLGVTVTRNRSRSHRTGRW
jgi:hypothetical protein